MRQQEKVLYLPLCLFGVNRLGHFCSHVRLSHTACAAYSLICSDLWPISNYSQVRDIWKEAYFIRIHQAKEHNAIKCFWSSTALCRWVETWHLICLMQRSGNSICVASDFMSIVNDAITLLSSTGDFGPSVCTQKYEHCEAYWIFNVLYV